MINDMIYFRHDGFRSGTVTNTINAKLTVNTDTKFVCALYTV